MINEIPKIDLSKFEILVSNHFETVFEIMINEIPQIDLNKFEIVVLNHFETVFEILINAIPKLDLNKFEILSRIIWRQYFRELCQNR